MTTISFQFFKECKIPLNWKTIFIGRKLGLLDNTFVEAFATEYLIMHPSSSNFDINELAYGVPDTYKGNLDLLELLEKITTTLYLEVPQKDSDSWNNESIKWQYVLIKKALVEAKSEKELQERIEDIYCSFEHPTQLEQFIPWKPNWRSDNIHTTLSDRLDHFLKNEQQVLKLG